MDKLKVVCYKNRPAIILSKSKSDLSTFVATMLYFIEEDDILEAHTDIVFDQAQITDYYCPYANEAMFPIIHCNNEGKCVYSVTPTKLSSMCLACKAESTAEFLHSEDTQAKLDSLLNELDEDM